MQDYTLKPHPEFGFLQIQPTPTPEEINRFYAAEFYSADYKRLNDSSLEIQLEDADFYKGHWDDLCTGIEEVAGAPLVDRTVLDIGCGWGQALLHFREKGMKCYGFDPAPEAVAYGKNKGLTLSVGGFENLDVFKMKFDVVALLNVLEHLADPVAVLEEIKKTILRPEGTLVVEVPNEFNAFQVTGRKIHDLKEWWVAPPGHLNYFSRTTLTRLLEGTGFSVKLSESSFPLELFLLMGRNYVSDPVLGKKCHKERVAFELNMRQSGQLETLRAFYKNLAELNLGRQVTVYAKA